MNDNPKPSLSRYLPKEIFLALAVVLIVAWVLPRPELSLFGYHSWRRLQTFAQTVCFRQAHSAYEFASCLFTPPIGANDLHYSGLEFPLFGLVDSLIQPDAPVSSTIPNVLPFFSCVLLISTLTVFMVRALGLIGGGLLGAATAFSLMRSPSVLFFLAGYQPDLFSISLILTAYWVIRVPRLLIIGFVMLSMGVLVKPQHAVLAAALLLPVYWEYFVESKLSKLLLPSAAAAVTGIIYFGGQKWFESRGLAFPYLHRLTLSHVGWNLPPGAEIESLARSELTYVGEPVAAALCLLSLFLAALIFRRKGFLAAAALALPTLCGLALTFIFFYPGFAANTYYSLIFVSGGIVLAVILADALTGQDLGRHDKIIAGGVAVYIALAAALLPATRDGVTDQMTDFSIRTCPPETIQSFLNSLPADTLIYANCQAMDPTCRAALNYKGTNIYHGALSAETPEAKEMLQKGGYYFSCYYYRKELLAAPQNLAVLDAHGRRVFENDQWLVYKLDRKP